MNFYVIKLKHIIIALLIFAVIPIIWFTTSRAVSVFNVTAEKFRFTAWRGMTIKSH